MPAYSTLGWFDDPVLSTFVRYPETEFARLIFHELAHQLIYVKDDTVFNESFATAVSDEGLERWIAAQPADVRARLDAERARSERLRERIPPHRRRRAHELDDALREDAPAADKEAAKRAIFAAMRADYERVRPASRGSPASIAGSPATTAMARTMRASRRSRCTPSGCPRFAR